MKINNREFSNDSSPPSVTLINIPNQSKFSMKKFIFLSAACILSNHTFSQITKKNWLVGGKATFQSNKTESVTSSGVSSEGSSLNLSINGGYFIFDKFAIGLQGGFFHYSSSFGSTSSSGTDYGIGSFARYYFLKNDSRYNLFSEAGFSHFFSNNGRTGSNTYSIAGGAVIFLNSSVGLELIPRYSITKRKDATIKAFSLDLGFQIHLTKD